MDALQRIEALEKQVRRQSWIIRSASMAVFGAVVIFIASAQQQPAEPKIIEAQRIRLMSPDGRMLVSMEAQDGHAGIYIGSGDEHVRGSVVIYSTGTEAQLLMRDAEGAVRTAVGYGKPSHIHELMNEATGFMYVTGPNGVLSELPNGLITRDAQWASALTIAHSVKMSLDVYVTRMGGKISGLPGWGREKRIDSIASTIGFNVDAIRGLRPFNHENVFVEVLDADRGLYNIIVRRPGYGKYTLGSDGSQRFER